MSNAPKGYEEPAPSALDVAGMRRRLGLTQARLAVAADVATNSVVAIEAGRPVRARTRRKVEEALRKAERHAQEG